MIPFLLKRPLGTITATLCLIIMAITVFPSMPISLYPHTEFPVLTINTTLGDSSPEEIETLITKPVEEAVADISGLRRIQSVSHFGESEITLQFHQGWQLEERALEVRSRIRRLLPLLPDDARFPTITRYDPSDFPAVVLAVTGKTSQEEAGEWVQHVLKPRLGRIDGVATVRVSGAPRNQITVDCDPGRLNAHRLTIHDVMASIKQGHQTLPAGFTTMGDRRVAIVTAGKLQSLSDIELQPVQGRDTTSPIRVAQLAEVRLGTEQPVELTRYNGEPLITVAVYRSTGADLRQISRDVKEVILETQAQDKTAPNMRTVTDQGKELNTILQRLLIMIILTGLITAAVLFFFLGNFFTTVVVLSSIPLSLFLTVLMMKGLGISLDLLSLGGLTLGLGILVDNSIVVVESISRRWSTGEKLSQGIISGSADVSFALCMATLTTVIVFLPVIFLSNEIRLLFSGFALTVASCLMASLLASLVLIPVLMQLLGERFDLLSQRSFSDFGKLSEKYSRLVALAGDHVRFVAFSTILFLGLAVFLAYDLSFRQTLSADEQRFRIVMVMPPGTSRNTTALEAENVESILLKSKWVEGIHTQIVGNQGTFTVSKKPNRWFEPRRNIDTDSIKKSLDKLSGVQFHVVPIGSQSTEAKISLSVRGQSIDRLEKLQDDILKSIRGVPGIRDVLVLQGNPSPVLEFPVQHESVGFLGFDAQGMAYHLRSHLTGPVAARMIEGERYTSVRVRAKRSREEGLESIQHGIMPGYRGESAPFLQLGAPALRLARKELSRENRRPVLRLNLILDGSDPLKVSDDVTIALEKILRHTGCDYGFGDEILDIKKTRQEMRGAIITSLALIYVTLIIATESLSLPLLIMTAVPFGIAGAVLALSTLGVAVTLPVYIGFMILCGLIVNVNVVMTHTINRLIAEGHPVDEAVKAGSTQRLRAIIMTVLTTFFASLPMLLDRGAGSSLWSPFALTVASGIICGALFSLVVTPILYLKLGSDRPLCR